MACLYVARKLDTPTYMAAGIGCMMSACVSMGKMQYAQRLYDIGMDIERKLKHVSLPCIKLWNGGMC